jgi:hypothetical protein
VSFWFEEADICTITFRHYRQNHLIPVAHCPSRCTGFGPHYVGRFGGDDETSQLANFLQHRRGHPERPKSRGYGSYPHFARVKLAPHTAPAGSSSGVRSENAGLYPVLHRAWLYPH